MTELTKTDLTLKGMGLMPSFWDERPKALGLLRSLLEAFENPNDLLFEILNGTSLFDAEGTQLDLIGKLWDEPRRGKIDAVYREDLFKTISQNLANSTPESIMEILKVAANATEIKLFEHYPGNVHVGLDVSIIESLKVLGDEITAAGVSFNARFEPTHDNVSGIRTTSFNYRNFNLLTGTWTPAFATYTTGTGVAPDGATTLFTVEDTSAVEFGRIVQQITIDGTKKYFISCWIIKDAGATHTAAIKINLTGGGNDNYNVHIDPTNGDYTTTSLAPDKVRVLDFNDKYFIWMEIIPLSTDHDTLVMTIYPAVSTVLGTFNVATLGTTEFWTPVVAEIDGTKHNSDYEVQGTLVLAERLLLEYFIVDNADDNIITELIELIVADSDSQYDGYGSQALSEFGDTIFAQPLTEVI